MPLDWPNRILLYYASIFLEKNLCDKLPTLLIVSPLDASNILFQLAKNPDFENEAKLWDEVELVLGESGDKFRQDIRKEYRKVSKFSSF